MPVRPQALQVTRHGREFDEFLSRLPRLHITWPLLIPQASDYWPVVRHLVVNFWLVGVYLRRYSCRRARHCFRADFNLTFRQTSKPSVRFPLNTYFANFIDILLSLWTSHTLLLYNVFGKVKLKEFSVKLLACQTVSSFHNLERGKNKRGHHAFCSFEKSSSDMLGFRYQRQCRKLNSYQHPFHNVYICRIVRDDNCRQTIG